MADSHPKNLDPRPKRRRDEDSPYEIYTAGINTAHPRFYLFFKDGGGVKRWMEIDKALFDAFHEFELDDLSFFNEVDRHYEQSEVTEATLNRRAAKPQESVEETVSQRMEVDKLHQAIAKLPEKQRRRLVLYYFGEFTYEQIAAMEECKFQVIAKSIKTAEKYLKKILIGG
ncbi:RNA polymerase sigma factor [Oscillibacter sp. CU971]|uniref:RNA polymerase sigma factor n=1 Tax=Oscillibacter sp. CU971 TaxID=2780102 RepID=UPI0019573454|nr:sigma-70 family RNA polymerase sigma factor [Oscillibacter sp. CU971]